MNIRAKFTLVAIEHTLGASKTLKFECRYDDTIPEDQRFLKATPWGQISMQVDNPVALEAFKLGESYYADFSPVAAEKAP